MEKGSAVQEISVRSAALMWAPAIGRPDSHQGQRKQMSPKKIETSQWFGHVSRNSIQSNVAPIMTVFEMNTRYGFICACPRRFECGPERGDRQDAAPGSFYVAAVAFSSGMENLHILELGRLVET